jgi:hypothetical protein
MVKAGPKKQPTERKRKFGYPSHRPLPDEFEVVALSPVTSLDRPRALGIAGRAEWDLIWANAYAWLAESDLAAVRWCCGAADDYVLARTSLIGLLADNDATERQRWRLRKQVQDTHLLLDRLASSIGLKPSARVGSVSRRERIREGMAGLMNRADAITMIEPDN